MSEVDILLVEDDEASAYALTRELQRDGFAIRGATSAFVALEEIEKNPAIRVLLLDVRLRAGEPHGVALARMARYRRKEVQVIYLTGYPDLAKEDAADSKCFVKPIDLSALEAELRSVLGPSVPTPPA